MHIMRKRGISSILVEPGDDETQWGIMTQRDIVTKIVGGNKMASPRYGFYSRTDS